MEIQGLLQAGGGGSGSGIAQALSAALLGAGGDVSGVPLDGRPLALMPDVKVCRPQNSWACQYLLRQLLQQIHALWNKAACALARMHAGTVFPGERGQCARHGGPVALTLDLFVQVEGSTKCL